MEIAEPLVPSTVIRSNLTSGIVLSTGQVADLVGTNTGDGGLGGLIQQFPSDLSTDFGVPDKDGDSITLQIDFDSDGSKDKIYFQYVFGFRGIFRSLLERNSTTRSVYPSMVPIWQFFLEMALIQTATEKLASIT